MKNAKDIVRFTAAELRERRAGDESRTDLARVRAKTEAELERDTVEDPDLRNVPENWHETAVAVMPTPKTLLSLRLDADVIEWFRSQGPGYQTRINAVLRAFVELDGERATRSRQRSLPPPPPP